MTGMGAKTTMIPFLFILLCLGPALGLYEDQIGKFDWVQQYVGVVENAVFESSVPARRIIVSTAQNVLAALSLKNGEIAWRHVMESFDYGRVDFLASEGTQVTTVSGNLLRTWDSVTAALIEEIQLDYTVAAGSMQRAVSLTDSEVILAEFIPSSLVVTTLDRSSGATLDHNTVAAPWLHEKTKCTSVEKTIVCVELSLGLVFTLPLMLDSPTFAPHPIASLDIDVPAVNVPVIVERVNGSPDHVVIQVGATRKLVHVHSSGLHVVRDLTGSRASAIADSVLYTITQTGRLVTIEAVELETGNELGDQGVEVELPFQSGTILSLVVHRFERRSGGIALRAFVSCSDHALHLISNAGVMWSREEALSTVLAAEAVDLPADGNNINYHDHLSPHAVWNSYF